MLHLVNLLISGGSPCHAIEDVQVCNSGLSEVELRRGDALKANLKLVQQVGRESSVSRRWWREI